MSVNNYHVFQDFESSKDCLKSLFNSNLEALSLDLETTSLDEYTGQVLGIGFSWEVHTGVYIPMNVRELGLFVSDLEPRWLPKEEKILIDLTRKLMVKKDIIKVAHNASFEIKWLSHHWDAEPINTFCTYWYRFIQHPDTSAGYEKRLSLGHIISEKYPDLIHLKDIWKDINKKPKDERDLSLYHTTQKIGEYCAGDSDVALREYISDSKDIIGKPFEKTFPNRLMPAIHFVSKMSHTGFDIDVDYLKRTRETLKVEQKSLLSEIQDTVKSVKFNPQSTQHLEDLFIRQYKLLKTTQKKFDKHSGKMLNKISLDEAVLTEYNEKNGYKVAGQILEYRKVSKLISTYFDGIESCINVKTGKIHADLKLWGTVTGRLSCVNPNLQNLPARDPKSRIVKNMFIAPEGHVLIGFDYSQIELRLVAYYSQDPLLLKAYRDGIDVHTLTASILFGVEVEKVTKEQRYIGKTSNFALVYGGAAGVLVYGAAGIGNKIMGPEYAEKIGVDYDNISTVVIDRDVLMSKARSIRKKYFEGYSRLKEYTYETIVQARKDEFVVSDYGRIRYLDGINSEDEKVREHWERCAVNTRPQSTASDYLLFHFMDMVDEFDRQKLGVNSRLMVHDQGVLSVLEDNADSVMEQIPILGIKDDEAHIGIPMKLEPVMGRHLGEV